MESERSGEGSLARKQFSLLQRFWIQLVARKPEINQMDFAAHIVIVFMFTIFYGYHSLRMDDDPEICYATESDKNNEIIDEQTAEVLGVPPTGEYEDVGHKFRLVFDILFYGNSLLLIA